MSDVRVKRDFTDFLVIGSGVAGLRAAIELSNYGAVTVITKDVPQESSTEYAQGGIAVALSDEDEVGIHYEDTLKAGDGLCREEAVRVLVEEGPERIMELISWGAEFDREGTKLAFGLEAAHSRKRILHAGGDSTGRELERVLINKARSIPSIRRLPFTLAMELVVRDGVCLGALMVTERRPSALFARATVLATGGAGQIYSITTNPQVSTGDGMALAYRAGAVLEDMEFVQFHPTSLFLPAAPHFLMTEALRGEGGRLLNIKFERFMDRYHTEMELAPRDVVSRSILAEMGRTGAGHVFLDLRHMGEDFVKRRFPRVYSTCLSYGLDITREPIPVCPAAHYIMGGVKTGIDGHTSIKGLFAAGETACTGVHGANRLASNSLLEGLVYGRRAGRTAGEEFLDRPAEREKQETFEEEIFKILMPPGSIPAHDEIRGDLRRLMWRNVGIVRTEAALLEAKERIEGWRYITEKTFFARREIELKNMVQVAGLITEAALFRKNSVGAHFRLDYPGRGEGWERHVSLVKKDGSGQA